MNDATQTALDDYVRKIDSPLYPPSVAVAAAWYRYRTRLLARDAA